MPLPFHQKAPLAHLASQAANEQGKFWPMHDKIFGGGTQKLERANFDQYAKEIGLDQKRFKEALDTGRGKALIDADIAEAKSIGVTGTPAFFVNGRYLSGAKPFAEFAAVINSELQKQNIPIPPAAQAALAAPAGAPGK